MGDVNHDAFKGRRGEAFPVLTRAQIARLRPLGIERSFSAGEIVFDQGDKMVPFYVVLEGELEIVHPRGTEEDPITLHVAGEFTGEMNLIAERRSLVRGRAKGPLRVLRVEHTKLQEIVQTDPELSEVFMRAFILRRMSLISEGLGDSIVIGSRDSAATLRLQAFLNRNAQPYRYVDTGREPDVKTLLDQFHVSLSDLPILVCRGERVLKNPTDAEVADCLGFNDAFDPSVVHDVIVCGAGPGGLAAAVYGASEGLAVLVLESSSPGGQAASSSKIENYLGFPTGISGQNLLARALSQAEKFGAKIAIARGASRLDCAETPIRIELTNGESVRARCVVIATGAEYRRLDVPGLVRFEGAGVYYAATFLEAQRCSEDEIVVVGGGNSAGQAAMFLAKTSKHVHMLIRGPDLAASMSRYLIVRIEDTPNITLRRKTRIVAAHGGGHLEKVTWRDDATGEETTKDIRHVFSMAGAAPNTRWLEGCVAMDAKGFVLTGRDVPASGGWPLERPPYLFETSQPRVFAVGDVRADSVKRVASAVGEGSVCIQLVHKVLHEDKDVAALLRPAR
jgi:thioredoxin reductase (NADPH)